MDEEWLKKKLKDLKIKNHRYEVLLEIRKRLTEAANLDSNITSILLSSSDIYQCIDDAIESNNSDEDKLPVELIKDILTICMSNLTLRTTDTNRLLLNALNNKQPCVRAVALRAIFIDLQSQMDVDNLSDVISDELLQHILETFQESETEVGSVAYNILCLVVEARLDQPLVIDAFKDAMKKNEVVRCRLYELAVTLAQRSKLTFEKMQFALDDAIKHLDNNDILLKVNILEIIAPLAACEHGLLYLEERKVFDLIMERIENMENNPLNKLLVPPFMNFFGKIAQIKPLKVFNEFPNMIRCLFDCLFSADPTYLPSAMDCFASLAATPEGINLLETNYDRDVKKFFEICSSSLSSLSTELKIRFFNNLEIIFDNSPKIISDINSILKQWFTHLNGNTNQMGFLMTYCKNPFPDIKISCLNLIRAFCLYKWGVEAVKDTAGLLEYLMDRKCEFDKEVKFAKYLVIKVLAQNSIFDVQTHIQLQTFVNQGPYYLPSNVQVSLQTD